MKRVCCLGFKCVQCLVFLAEVPVKGVPWAVGRHGAVRAAERGARGWVSLRSASAQAAPKLTSPSGCFRLEPFLLPKLILVPFTPHSQLSWDWATAV